MPIFPKEFLASERDAGARFSFIGMVPGVLGVVDVGSACCYNGAPLI